MTQPVVSSAGDEVMLLRGAMQNWSDLALGSIADSSLVRGLIESAVAGARSCLVVGAHSLELVAGLAQTVSVLTVVTRSIPDARAIASTLGQLDEVSVYCGDLAEFAARGDRYDLVLALDDLDRVVSLETEETTWATVAGQVAAVLADEGRGYIGIENELGLHRLASLRSRYAADGDRDWAVLSTYDVTRPRTSAQVRSPLTAAGLDTLSVHAAYADWTRPVALATNLDGSDQDGGAGTAAGLTTLLALVAEGAPSRHRVLADPSRVTQVAASAGLLGHFAAGWLVEVAPAGSGSQSGGAAVSGAVTPRLIVDSGLSTFAFESAATTEEADAVEACLVRRELDRADRVSSVTTLTLPAGSTLFCDELAAACAAHRLPQIRMLLTEYAQWVADRADAEGMLDEETSAAALDNVVRSGDEWVVLLSGAGRLSATERTWYSFGNLVAVLRDRGGRHPWPSATDDVTLLSILGAMAGVAPVESPAAFLTAPPLPPGDAIHTVAALLSVVDRLTEQNTATASRAAWFERRLNERERELRTLTAVHEGELRAMEARQESLRRNVSDLKGSASFRAGKLMLSPVVRARDAARKLRD